ncbi:MAG: glycosyltransferase [Pirellulales bacterium]
MKIVLSNTFYPPDIAGGAEVIASGLARYLQARGHELSVLTVNRDRNTVRDHVEGIEVTRLGVRNFYWHHPRIRRHPLLRLMWHYRDAYNRSMESSIGRFLDEKQPDLLFSHNLPGLSAALWKAADQRRIPVVQVLHDYYSLCPRSTLFHRGTRCVSSCGTCGYLRRNHRDYSAQVDTVVGVSRAVLQQHLDRGVFAAAAEQCVIHNAKQIGQQ